MKDFPVSMEMDFVKAAVREKSGEFVIHAYASTYDVDDDETQITREALELAKNDLLERSTVLFNHNPDRPVGKVVETKIDDKGLLVKIVLSSSESDLLAKVKDGTISKLSIAGRILDFKETADVAKSEEGESSESERSILQITKLKLYEVSLVSVPANKEAKTLSNYVSKYLEIAKSADAGEAKKSLLGELELLAGRLSGENKQVVDRVISFFKTAEVRTTKKYMTYDFEEKSEGRPIFQINLAAEDNSIELSDSNTFRKQLLKKGKWFHWGADNGVLEITEEKIDNIIKNFKKKVVDSVGVPLTHTSDPLKNTGHVVKLVKTEEGLDAVIEIKDSSVAEKIRKGLITAISASFDPNYMTKTNKKFVGPVLLHAALVAEPFIKGMGKFVELSDEFEGRPVIQLEDAEQDNRTLLKMAFDILRKVEDNLEKEAEESAPEDEEVVEEEATEEAGEKEEVEEPAETSAEEVEEEVEEETDEEKKASAVVDASEDESESADTAEEGEESEESGDVALSDSEELYNKYLKAGRIVPAQKVAFIQLCDSLRNVELSDSATSVAQILDNFLSSQTQVINFEESGTSQEPDVPVAEEQAPSEPVMPTDVKRFYTEKLNMSEDQAHEAWKEALEMNAFKEEKSIFE